MFSFEASHYAIDFWYQRVKSISHTMYNIHLIKTFCNSRLTIVFHTQFVCIFIIYLHTKSQSPSHEPHITAHQINITNNTWKTKLLPQEIHICSKSIPREEIMVTE